MTARDRYDSISVFFACSSCCLLREGERGIGCITFIYASIYISTFPFSSWLSLHPLKFIAQLMITSLISNLPCTLVANSSIWFMYPPIRMSSDIFNTIMKICPSYPHLTKISLTPNTLSNPAGAMSHHSFSFCQCLPASVITHGMRVKSHKLPRLPQMSDGGLANILLLKFPLWRYAPFASNTPILNPNTVRNLNNNLIMSNFVVA